MDSVAHLTIFLTDGTESTINNLGDGLAPIMGHPAIGLGYYYLGRYTMLTFRAMELKVRNNGTYFYVMHKTAEEKQYLKDILTEYADEYPAYYELCYKILERMDDVNQFRIMIDDTHLDDDFTVNDFNKDVLTRYMVDSTDEYAINPSKNYGLFYAQQTNEMVDVYKVHRSHYYPVYVDRDNTIIVCFENSKGILISVGQIAIDKTRLMMRKSFNGHVHAIAPVTGDEDYHANLLYVIKTMIVEYKRKHVDIHHAAMPIISEHARVGYVDIDTNELDKTFVMM